MKTPPTPSDRDLLHRSAARDLKAFQLFYQRYRSTVHRLVTAIAGEAAEDAFQETFLALWKSSGDFKGDGSARSWVLAVSRRAAWRQHRRRRGEPSTMETLEELGWRAGWSRGKSSFSSRLEDRDLLSKGFRVLGAEDREILLLRHGEDLTGPETAEILDLTLAATKSRLHRARLSLVAALRKTES